QLVTLGQRLVRKVIHQFFGRQVHIIKRDNPGIWLLANLRPPASLSPGIEALAKLEAEFFPQANQAGEMLARRAVSVVVMIGPAKTQAALPGLLKLRSAVAALPVFPLGEEEEVAGEVGAEAFYRG